MWYVGPMDQKEREALREEMRDMSKRNGVSEAKDVQPQENMSQSVPNAAPKEDATRTGPYKGKY
jgi:hypothetical protein